MVWVHETLFNILHSRISEPCWTYNPPSRLLLDDWNFLVCEEKRRKRSLFYPINFDSFFFLSFFFLLFIDVSKSRMTEALNCILFIRVGDYEIRQRKQDRDRSQHLGKSSILRDRDNEISSFSLFLSHTYTHSLRSSRSKRINAVRTILKPCVLAVVLPLERPWAGHDVPFYFSSAFIHNSAF